MIGNSNDETNFPHKLLLTKIHVLALRKTFTTGSTGNIKLLKSQLHKIDNQGDV